MEKALKIINQMNKVELSATGDLSNYTKKANDKTSEMKALASKFKQLKQEYGKMESTLNQSIQEAQRLRRQVDVYIDPVLKSADALGVKANSIKEVQQWEAAALDLNKGIFELVNLLK